MTPPREHHSSSEPLAGRMTVFLVICAGQFASLFGTALAGFALGVWVFERTGSAIQYAAIALSTVVPRLLLSPLAGVLADRWDRRLVMIAGDGIAAVSTVAVLALSLAGRLEVWHVYVGATVAAIGSTVQRPAYAAAVGQLVPQPLLGRANGMVQLGQAVAEILAPALAGVLVLSIRLQGVLLLDLAMFLVALSTLLAVRFSTTPVAAGPREPILQAIVEGLRFVFARPGLLGLLGFLAAVNVVWAMFGAVAMPMVLGFAGPDAAGLVFSIAGAGMLAGGVAMSAWGGPRRRVNGVLAFELISGLGFVLVGLRPQIWLVAVGAFCAHFTIAIVVGCNRTLWQTKVPPPLQGRAFATLQMVSESVAPVGLLLAGALADRVFTPLLLNGGLLAGSAGSVLGTGPGRGIALLILCLGVLKIAVSVAGWLNPRIRRVEDELPDVAPPSAPQTTVEAQAAERLA